ELAVGKMGQALGFAADAGEFFDVIVPGGYILIAYGPIDCDTFFGVGLEIEITEAIALPAPGERAAADLVAAYPIEGIILYIGMFPVVDVELFSGFGVGLALNGVFFFIFFSVLEQMWELPGAEEGRGIIFYMGDIATSFEDEGCEACFTEFLGCPAAADARADNDGVKSITAHMPEKSKRLRINIVISRYFEL